jgi:DNA-binding protein Fis
VLLNGHSSSDYERVVLNSFDLSEAESRLISRALEVTDGNRTRAAELLGLSVRTLRNKLNALPKS